MIHSEGAPRIGYAAIPAAQLITGALIEDWLELVDEEGHPVQRGKNQKVAHQYVNLTTSCEHLRHG